MAEPIVMYCKSYEGDIHRVERLWQSIEAYNANQLRFYISVPERDIADFKKRLPHDSLLTLLTDEEIVSVGPGDGLKHYREWPGQLSQQVVKSEFWRLDACESYLLLDSDNVFIRPFRRGDFLSPDNTPYTVITQGKEFRQLSLNKGIEKIQRNFLYESQLLKRIFERSGPDYDFGIPPVVWSKKVWSDLYEKYLAPRRMLFWDAITLAPIELRWYGEALLKYRSIPLIPVEPFFRSYLYSWQYYHLKKNGETLDTLKEHYLGVVYQSNWQTSLDSISKKYKKNFISRNIRDLKLLLSRFR